ncbi:MAG: hypothetical protein Q4A36_01995 [Candidatus Saccharibacteria bacterium]|nr:hypothetical protein [Candidatus Saccharibacteria bacterium]
MDNKQSFTSGQPGQPTAQPGQPLTAAFSQPITSPRGADMSQPMQPVQPAQPMPEAQKNPITGVPMIMQAAAAIPEPKKDYKPLIRTIAIIALSLISVTFIGLFIWMYTQYDDARTNVDGQINVAVTKAIDENTMKLENEFAEREKYPFQTFAGPEDYGGLTFEYPKTWSVYVAADASHGGDFEAYLNPVEVYEVGDTTIDALRVKVLNTAFDDVAAMYQRDLEGDQPTLRLESVVIGQNNDIPANKYIGIIPGTEFDGYIIVFKIRDKTAILQTDSKLFEADYNTLLASVRFNA